MRGMCVWWYGGGGGGECRGAGGLKIQNKWQTLACCQGNSEIALLRKSQPDWCGARTAET